MKRMRFALAGAAAIAMSTVVAAQQPYNAVAADKDDHLTVTGCVVRGDGGYLLTNVSQGPRDDDATRASGFPAPSVAAPGTPDLAQILYWFKNDDKLRGHEGQRVEVQGKLEGDLKKGQMEVRHKDNGVEIEAKADGKKVKAVLPEGDTAIGTTGVPDKDHKKVELNYMMRRFEVKSVKMITSRCQ